MKLLFIAGREPEYVRNAVMLKALQRNGVEVLDCSDASKGYPKRLAHVVMNFLRARGADFDGIFVGFFGQPLMPLIAGLSRKPILFDAFLSAYDTMCFDRKKFAPGSLPGRFFYALDKHACEKADLVLLDTNTYIEYFCSTFGLPRHKFRRVLVGADESLFYPREVTRPDGDKFRVFYYASYLPLHGTEFIVRAAHLLQAEADIELVVVGSGPERARVRALSEELRTTNVRFIDWLPYERLPLEIAQSDVCLGGHFSDIPKAKRVIAGKTYQFIAMRKAVILGDCAGNRELFQDGQNALMVTMADAEALARGITKLRDDVELRHRLAEQGHRTFLEHCSIEAISGELARVLGDWQRVQ
jgi:glycosyltransferase involved in cell wall biosynthesis